MFVVYLLSCVKFFGILWTVACQPPLSMGFPRQEYWCELPFPALGDLPDSGIEPISPALQVDSLPAELPGKPNYSGKIRLNALTSSKKDEECPGADHALFEPLL